MAGFEKWNPVSELIALQDRMNNLLKEALASSALSNDRAGLTWSPPVDFYETTDAFLLTAELPGMKQEDLEIQVEVNTLTLEGKRSRKQDEKDLSFFRKERFFGDFRRVFNLPSHVNPGDIQAELKNGVLQIQLPKTKQDRRQSFKVNISN